MIMIYYSTFGLRFFLCIGSTTKVVRVPLSAVIFTFPPNLPLAKGGLWQVFHLQAKALCLTQFESLEFFAFKGTRT